VSFDSPAADLLGIEECTEGKVAVEQAEGRFDHLIVKLATGSGAPVPLCNIRFEDRSIKFRWEHIDQSKYGKEDRTREYQELCRDALLSVNENDADEFTYVALHAVETIPVQEIQRILREHHPTILRWNSSLIQRALYIDQVVVHAGSERYCSETLAGEPPHACLRRIPSLEKKFNLKDGEAVFVEIQLHPKDCQLNVDANPSLQELKGFVVRQNQQLQRQQRALAKAQAGLNQAQADMNAANSMPAENAAQANRKRFHQMTAPARSSRALAAATGRPSRETARALRSLATGRWRWSKRSGSVRTSVVAPVLEV
jgi:hypothetical protein